MSVLVCTCQYIQKSGVWFGMYICKCPVYDIKQSDGEAALMLDIWEM